MCWGKSFGCDRVLLFRVVGASVVDKKTAGALPLLASTLGAMLLYLPWLSLLVRRWTWPMSTVHLCKRRIFKTIVI